MDDIAQFDFPTDSPKIIKVIGVGGGGGNAVNHMYREGIHDVTFVLCNTDNQALKDSPVPVKLQLGKEGLGAGNRPARARKAAEESIEDIKAMLNDGTKMVFITAGMGGGRYRCSAYHCTDRQRNGHPDYRHRHYPVPLGGRQEDRPSTGRRGGNQQACRCPAGYQQRKTERNI